MKRFAEAALLATTCLLVLGWFDHHAAEYDPQHMHLAPGMFGVALDLGLIFHEHAFATDHSHRREPGRALTSTSGPGVMPATPLFAFGKGSVIVPLPLKDAALPRLVAVDEVPAYGSAQFTAVDLAPIVPPPRSVQHAA